MEQRVNIITLGVEDLADSTAFYEALGWRRSSASQDGITFFQAGGIVLALFPRAGLAEDACLASLPPKPPAAVTLAQNQPSREAVDAVIAEAVTAGATLVKAAEDVFWGGYSGYFADPDGHLWEIAWHPFFPLDEDGLLNLPT